MALDPARRARFHEAPAWLIDRMRAIDLINGCGSGYADVPDFMWEEDCDEHDFDYTVGGTEDDRQDAEWRFHVRMILRIDEVYSYWNPMRFFARLTAWSYYRGVKALGAAVSFSFRDKGLTLAELEALVEEEERKRASA